MTLGDFFFQRINRFGPCFGIGHAGQLQRICDKRLILDAGRLEPIIINQIIITVGHPKAALARINAVLAVILQVELNTDFNRACNAQLAVFAQRLGQIIACLKCVNLCQHRLDRFHAARLNGGFVHKAGVKITHLLRHCTGGCVQLCRIFDDLAGARVRQIAQNGKTAPA